MEKRKISTFNGKSSRLSEVMFRFLWFILTGVIQRLQEYYKTPYHGVTRSYLCTVVDHYAGSYGDKGWGCGYRNFQMLLSSLVTEEMYCKVLFNGEPTTSIQDLFLKYSDNSTPYHTYSKIAHV